MLDPGPQPLQDLLPDARWPCPWRRHHPAPQVTGAVLNNTNALCSFHCPAQVFFLPWKPRFRVPTRPGAKPSAQAGIEAWCAWSPKACKSNP